MSLQGPGLDDKQNQALAVGVRRSRPRARCENSSAMTGSTALAAAAGPDRLRSGGIDEGAILAIAEQLTDQMSLEAA